MRSLKGPKVKNYNFKSGVGLYLLHWGGGVGVGGGGHGLCKQTDN